MWVLLILYYKINCHILWWCSCRAFYKESVFLLEQFCSVGNISLANSKCVLSSSSVLYLEFKGESSFLHVHSYYSSNLQYPIRK